MSSLPELKKVASNYTNSDGKRSIQFKRNTYAYLESKRRGGWWDPRMDKMKEIEKVKEMLHSFQKLETSTEDKDTSETKTTLFLELPSLPPPSTQRSTSIILDAINHLPAPNIVVAPAAENGEIGPKIPRPPHRSKSTPAPSSRPIKFVSHLRDIQEISKNNSFTQTQLTNQDINREHSKLTKLETETAQNLKFLRKVSMVNLNE
jgi:hypothetical protein